MKEDQQEEFVARHVMPVYSRLIVLNGRTPAGIGQESFVTSPAVGNECWLLGVDVWVSGTIVGTGDEVYIYLATGQWLPMSVSEIRNEWEKVFPFYGGLAPALEWCGGDCHLHFSMRKLYTGARRVFALGLHNFSAAGNVRVDAGFEISEGT